MKLFSMLLSIGLGFSLAIVEESFSQQESPFQLSYSSAGEMKKEIMDTYMAHSAEEVIDLSQE